MGYGATFLICGIVTLALWGANHSDSECILLDQYTLDTGIIFLVLGLVVTVMWITAYLSSKYDKELAEIGAYEPGSIRWGTILNIGCNIFMGISNIALLGWSIFLLIETNVHVECSDYILWKMLYADAIIGIVVLLAVMFLQCCVCLIHCASVSLT